MTPYAEPVRVPVWGRDQDGPYYTHAVPHRNESGEWRWNVEPASVRGTWDEQMEGIAAHVGIPLPPGQPIIEDEFDRRAKPFYVDQWHGRPLTPRQVWEVTGGAEGNPPDDIDWRPTESIPEDFFAMARYGGEQPQYGPFPPPAEWAADVRQAFRADTGMDADADLAGACFHAAVKMRDVLADRGIPTRVVGGAHRAVGVHAWLEAPDGTIIDPTVSQLVPRGSRHRAHEWHDVVPGDVLVLPTDHPRHFDWVKDTRSGEVSKGEWRDHYDQSVFDYPVMKEPDRLARYERRHAPTGFTYGEKQYRPGQFIPGTVLFSHTPAHAPFDGRWRPDAPADVQPAHYDEREDPWALPGTNRGAGEVPWPPLDPPASPENQTPQPDDAQPAEIPKPRDQLGRRMSTNMLEWGRTDSSVGDELRQMVHPEDKDLLEHHIGGDSAGVRDLRTPGPPGVRQPLGGIDPVLGEHIRNMQELAGWSDPKYAHDYFTQLAPELQTQVLDFLNVQPANAPGDAQPAAAPPTLEGEWVDQLDRLGVHSVLPGYDSAVRDYLDFLGPEKAAHLAAALGVENAPDAIGRAVAEGKHQTLRRPDPTPEPEPHHPDKHALQNHPIVRQQRLGGGANASILVTFGDADGSQGVFKPQSGEADLRYGVPNGTYFKRESASSAVADILGFDDLVPPTTIRAHQGDIGSVQRFVPMAQMASEFVEEDGSPMDVKYDGIADAARAAVFDYIVGHNDRHDGNWLLKVGDDGQPKLVLIDNGLSFPTRYHRDDFFNYEFWEHAGRNDLPLPDVSALRGKWPRIERALLEHGLEPQAIELTRQRYEEVTSGVHRTFGTLPVFWRGGGRLNMRGMFTRRP